MGGESSGIVNVPPVDGVPEQFYRALFDQRADGMFRADDRGHLIEVNLRFSEMLGYQPQELLSLPLRDLIPIPDLALDPIGFDELSAEKTLHKERRLRRRDGTLLRVNISAWLLPGGSFVALVQDLANTSLTEEQLQELRESEHRLERAERMAQVGWWDRDFVTGYVHLSAETCRIFGLAEDRNRLKLEEWRDHWRALIHPDDRAQAVEAYTAALRGGPNYDVEYRVIRPSGEERFVRSQGEVTLNESGGPRRIFGTMHDITDRRLLEMKNEQLIVQFHQAQKVESIGRLAGGIAHDFNNLLMPIIGWVDLALGNPDAVSGAAGELVQMRRTDLEKVLNAAERAATLTSQILAYSRQQVLELKVLDLNDVIAGFRDMMQRLIGEDIQLETFLAPNLSLMRADKGQLEQVVMNLAINARDAMARGGKLTIETANVMLDDAYVELRGDGLEAGSYVMLAVSDTGQGMDAATRAHIFDPFYTTKSRGKGTGLGLATVFGIVKQHRGHIAVYSEPGHGTTFKIYLPQAAGATEAETPAPPEPASVHGTETVLVVEDEEMVRELVCETLAAHGYHVLEADSPAHALDLAARDTIHLLLTDVIMPEMNGRELYERLSALQPDCDVLYISGYTRNVIVHHNIMDEGISFLPKPFTINALTRKVREVLDRDTPPDEVERPRPESKRTS